MRPRLALLIAAAAAAMAGPALAGRAVTLRSDTVNADGIVKLGDIFANAGPAANVPVARRPEDSVVLNARAVQLAAARAGLDWANAEGLQTIVVRAGFSPTALRGAAAQRGNVEVLTYARDIAAGEVLGPTDLIWAKAVAAPGDAPSDPDAVIGKAARRPLRAGAPVAEHDVAAPIVVRAGEMITVSFNEGGVSLALQGKAMSAGGAGDVINVQNISSKKTIQAVVTGPGQAVVGPTADRLKSSDTRIAFR